MKIPFSKVLQIIQQISDVFNFLQHSLFLIIDVTSRPFPSKYKRLVALSPTAHINYREEEIHSDYSLGLLSQIKTPSIYTFVGHRPEFQLLFVLFLPLYCSKNQYAASWEDRTVRARRH